MLNCFETRAQAAWSPGCVCWGEVIGWQGTGLSLLLQSPALGWPCALAPPSPLSTCWWQSSARGLLMGGRCLLLPAAASLLFAKAVPQGSTAWCLAQRMPVIKAVAWGFTVRVAGLRVRREGTDLATAANGIWPRVDVESLLQYAFPFLISSWAELVSWSCNYFNLLCSPCLPASAHGPFLLMRCTCGIVEEVVSAVHQCRIAQPETTIFSCCVTFLSHLFFLCKVNHL